VADHRPGDARLGGDRLEGGALEALAREAALQGVEDLLATGRGEAGARHAGCLSSK
jgi:hypothetical protein